MMVVLLIIAVIAGVAVPVYNIYIIKSRFTEVFVTVNSYKSDLSVAYLDNDKFPSSFEGLTSGSASTVSSAVLKVIYYGRSTNAQNAYLNFFTLDLGVPGYVEPDTSGNGGTYSRITIVGVTTSTNYMQVYCGQWDGSNEDVPLTYLPTNCQDTNLSALIS